MVYTLRYKFINFIYQAKLINICIKSIHIEILTTLSSFYNDFSYKKYSLQICLYLLMKKISYRLFIIDLLYITIHVSSVFKVKRNSSIFLVFFLIQLLATGDEKLFKLLKVEICVSCKEIFEQFMIKCYYVNNTTQSFQINDLHSLLLIIQVYIVLISTLVNADYLYKLMLLNTT